MAIIVSPDVYVLEFDKTYELRTTPNTYLNLDGITPIDDIIELCS